ncbi:MAG: RIP metalloprotease RseP [Gemmatimonadetes bacterium]|nr:RIP metalloprotease RseP [Gemmatimonadota bacterium]
MILAVLLLLLVTDLLILVHELGHLVAAKWAGMPVTSFSVGFGPPLFRFRIGETSYQLALIPLGGFVRIMGMRGTEEDRRQWPNGFAFQRVHRRMIVVLAGVAANAALALAIFAILGSTGAATPPTPARVSAVFEDDLPLDAAGWEMMRSDIDVIRVAGRKVSDWGEFAMALLAVDPGPQSIAFADGESMQVTIPELEGDRIQLLASLLPPLVPVLGTIQPGSPAERAGLLTGDRIVAVEGQATPTFYEWLEAMPYTPAAPVSLRVLRNGAGVDIWVPQPDRDFVAQGSFGWLGAHLGTEFLDKDLDEDFGSAIAYGAGEVGRHTRMISESGKLLVTGAVGLREVSGPVEIARMSERAYRMNWPQFFAFVAFLSLNLAILNFLPIPVLDGGHFLLLTVEGLIRRPLHPTLVRYTNVAGATVVVFFMSFAFLNDLLKLLGL